MYHHLKIWPEYFEAVTHEDPKQRKTLELGYNDRGYRAGDHLVLEEFDPLKEAYTGRKTERLVTHIVSGEPWLQERFVAMSIVEIEIEKMPSISREYLRITKGYGWYHDKVGEEFEVLRRDGFDYVVWEDEDDPENNYDYVQHEDCEIFYK